MPMILQMLILQAVELMVIDALEKANDYLQISSYIHDPSEYWKVQKTTSSWSLSRQYHFH